MATTKNITMKQFNGTDYDTLYPKTIAEQVDGIYGKDEILSNVTKALYGLTDSAVPDDALALLSRFHKGLGNEYVWGKSKQAYSYSETSDTAWLTDATNQTTSYTWYYSDSFEINDGLFSLVNQQSVTATYNTFTNFNVLKGKYTYRSDSKRKSIFKVPSDASVEQYATGGSYYARILNCTYLYEINSFLSTVGYVNSPDPNAYPPAVSDGYTYTPLGQIGAKVQIATGSYTGTGTYGSSNPNSLTFDFEPKFLAIFGPLQFGAKLLVTMIKTDVETEVVLVTNDTYFNSKVSWAAGNTVSWYSTSNAAYQANSANEAYNYLAIG